MQVWNNLRGDAHVLSTLLSDRRYPKRPTRTRRIGRLVAPPNGGNRYGVRLTAYYKVRGLLIFFNVTEVKGLIEVIFLISYLYN